MHEKLAKAGSELWWMVKLLRDETFCDSCRAEMLFRLAERAAVLADAVADAETTKGGCTA